MSALSNLRRWWPDPAAELAAAEARGRALRVQRFTMKALPVKRPTAAPCPKCPLELDHEGECI